MHPAAHKVNASTVHQLQGRYAQFQLSHCESLSIWVLDFPRCTNEKKKDSKTFVKVNLSGKKAMSVAAGSHRSLFILEGGELRNAGLNHNGQLGIRNNTNTTWAVDTGHGCEI